MTVPYRLGIDIGTNSLGWCALDLGREGEPKSIRRIGVRIFSNGRAPDDTPLAVERRGAKGARKRRDRFIDRRDDLMAALIRHGLMPTEGSARKQLEGLDPYELRAIGLDALLPPHHFGRAIFHLNQRRGFNSNRKTDRKQKADDIKGMKGGIGKLRQAISDADARTLGEYLFIAFRKGRSVRGSKDGKVKAHATLRARPHVVKGKNEYDLYADRAMYEQEFDLLWQRQTELGSPLSDVAYKEIKNFIFFQRPLKPVQPGKCALDPSDERAPLALPIVQRFRMLSELANLEIVFRDQTHRFLSREERDKILKMLMAGKKLTFDKIRGAFGLGTEVKFNLESEKRDHLKGDATASGGEKRNGLAHKDYFGPAWWTFSLERQNEIVEFLLDEASEEKVIERAVKEWDLSEEAAANVADASLPDGYGRLGRKALSKIVPIMETGVIKYHEAAALAGYNHSSRDDGEVFDQLPYYGQVLEHAVIGTGDEKHEPEQRYGRIPNPTVHVAMNELRKVVNALSKKYGPPAEIVVELARDLPLGQKAKKELKDEQAENQEKNDKRRKTLAGLGLPENGENMLRLRLWDELGEEQLNKRCVYTGEQISIGRLFGPEVEIEHILPFKRTLDNSPANKTVSMRSANRYKGNRSPQEAFGESRDDFNWEEILLRATALPKNKRWRFSADAMEKFEGKGDFLARQLVDTQYISRLTREYLTKIAGPYKVWVITGRLTEMLRGKWGLNSLLSGHNRKNRYDHRHHAIDAFVAGVTDRSMLQRVASASDQFRERLIDDMPDPWDGYRDELAGRLDKIVISHKPDHGVQGRLHEDSSYGIVKHPEKEGGATLVYRKGLAGLNPHEVERIRDKTLRDDVKQATEHARADKKEFAKALAEYAEKHGIRHVRLTKVEDGYICIKDKNGEAYKAVIPGENAYVEIYETPDGKWQGEGVSVFKANQKDYHPQWRSKNPDAKFVMRAHKGDLLKLSDGVVYKVYQLDASKDRFKLGAHNESGSLQKRHDDGEDPFRWVMNNYGWLKANGARKVTVDYLGRVNDPGPPK
ncbi:MAG: type II CRISPR RNA-guided endonuclease Cas9 [Rhodospirillales bacterium]|nr:type II CRISPR RNA-guided endonuclease Cas9 [Rhodospirillales bacterium]